LHSIAYQRRNQINQWIVKLYDEDAAQLVNDGQAFKTKEQAVTFAERIVRA